MSNLIPLPFLHGEISSGGLHQLSLPLRRSQHAEHFHSCRYRTKAERTNRVPIHPISPRQGRNGVLTARQTSGCWTPLHLCWQGSGPRSDFHNIPFPTPPPVPTGALGRERSRLIHPDRGGGGEQAQADWPHLRLLLLVDQDQHRAARDPPEEDQNLLLLLAISHSTNAPVPEKVNSSKQPQQRFFVIHQTSIIELCRPKKNLLEYLAEIPKTASQQDMFMAEGKASER